MLQYLAIIGFFILAVLIFALGLYFSQYKKREDAGGCCGGGACGTNGTSHSCYSSKSNFVDNLDKIKAQKIKR